MLESIGKPVENSIVYNHLYACVRIKVAIISTKVSIVNELFKFS